MRVVLLAAVACALVSCEHLVLKNRVEPIPTDKCGANVIADEDDRLYVFSLAEDSVIWFKFQKAQGGWAPWQEVADRKKMTSGPKAIRHINGTIQLFARGPDRRFYVSLLQVDDWKDSASINTTSWTNWVPISGELEFISPPTPVLASDGRIYVFGISPSHSVMYSVSAPFNPQDTFSKWEDLGGESTSPVSVLVDAESLLHVFIRGSNRGLWHLSENFTHTEGSNIKVWGRWECLGGVMASSPRVPVTLNGANLVEVYGRASNKGLWTRRMVAHQDTAITEWDSWVDLGGVLASGPSVAVTDDGVIDVFARATDKAIYYKSQFENENGEVKFTKWNSLGGMFSTTPTVIVRSDGLVDIFSRGIDKAIWHSHQVERNGTRSFTSWHSLGGHTRKFTC